VCFAALSYRDLPIEQAAFPAPVITASSTLAPGNVGDALDGRVDTAWRSDPARGPDQVVTLDFTRPREFGGIVLHWLDGQHASRYDISFSDDGVNWRTVRHVLDGNGDDDAHFLPESEARYVRLHLHDGPKKAYALAEIAVKELAYGASPNAFFTALARQAPRGVYPRSFAGEQSYWTVLGVDGGSAQGLLSEDGALDLGPRHGSLEPFLIVDGKLISWADVRTDQSLREGYLPIPTVTWHRGELTLDITAFGAGDRARSQIIAEYTLENSSHRTQSVTLALAVRPFQVNPPTQFLNTPGGVAPIHAMSWDGKAFNVNDAPRILPLRAPDEIVTADFDAGNIAELLTRPQRSRTNQVRDETGFASGALLYRIEVPPGGRQRVAVVIPLEGASALPAGDVSAWLDDATARVASEWQSKLNRVALHLPASAASVADTLRTALAHILVSRTGPELRPGTRSYARSWIRDGAMMSDALLRLGHADVVTSYTAWFAAYQFRNGKVPCCVDARGADPVVENDSPGEFIHLVAETYRYTHDREWLQKLWPNVAAAARYMNDLRLGERTARNQIEERRAFYGLMPRSISHEGYSDRPAYSYWDDFWALAGYDGAIVIANALNRTEDTARLTGERDEFVRDLETSIKQSIAQHHIAYIPGSADRGDFDPTSTAIALTVASGAPLPQPQVDRTFDRYWHEFVARRDGAPWDVYTPYELRNVSAFVRLGWRERVRGLLEFFLSDRRPAAWNQWAEVVGRNAREPRFIGDMPHAWVASDFIRAAIDLFAYERTADRALIIAAGVPVEWLDGGGVTLENLRTPYGALSYTLRLEGRHLRLSVGQTSAVPPGGIILCWPYAGAPGATTINGHAAEWREGTELMLRSVPAEVTVEVPGR
ncbi:MAG TPA: discoidin domain-containing protein, partial [Burkholderiales bacterium]|nr:discoidin domain-containing protein [Burkholderiales bacterium]